ncbi:TPA: LamG-like jellyroll fold domain-containing protein [Pseudomonas aeruginosa]|uniref:LamG-like jellyroll fold domain-containing protein n=1 Tax=Pseudomonas aeruginosa TaxID=287 RepID=UPI002AFF60C7|nr:LamG-like jellyroll fold domain-containing protein [Pseudomonas aeruginosa]
MALPNGFNDWAQGISAFALWNTTGVRSWERVFDLGNGIANNNILLSRNGVTSQLSFGVWNGTSSGPALNGGTIVNGRWQLVGITMGADRVAKLWIDGQIVATSTLPSLPQAVNRTSNMLGYSPWGEQTDARMAAVAIFNKGLSDARAVAYWDTVKDQLNRGRLNNSLRLELWSVRDGLNSQQRHDVTVTRSS